MRFRGIISLLVIIPIIAYCIELILFMDYRSRSARQVIDPRTKLEVVEDLRAQGIDAWPSVTPAAFIKSDGLLFNNSNSRLFPLGGISQKKIVYCNATGHHEILTSDEHGFKNPKGLYRKGSVDIALVGDYFAFGHCGLSGDSIEGRLQKIGIKAMSFGIGNNGPLINLAILKEYIEYIQPRIVLWGYFEGNDLRDLERERTSSILMHYLEDGYTQNLLERQDEIDTAIMEWVNSNLKNADFMNRELSERQAMKDLEMERRKYLKNILKLKLLRYKIGLINKSSLPQPPQDSSYYRSQLSLFSKIISNAYKRTLKWGGRFYFIYIPAMERYIAEDADGSLFNRDAVLNIVNEIGIPVIDLHEAVKEIPQPLAIDPFYGAHYSVKSYDMVQDLIITRLKEDGLLTMKKGD